MNPIKTLFLMTASYVISSCSTDQPKQADPGLTIDTLAQTARHAELRAVNNSLNDRIDSVDAKVDKFHPEKAVKKKSKRRKIRTEVAKTEPPKYEAPVIKYTGSKYGENQMVVNLNATVKDTTSPIQKITYYREDKLTGTLTQLVGKEYNNTNEIKDKTLIDLCQCGDRLIAKVEDTKKIYRVVLWEGTEKKVEAKKSEDKKVVYEGFKRYK